MSDINITVSGTKRLLVAGKRHVNNIVVTAMGGESYQDGWSDGHSDGYQEGYTAGYDGGYDEGQYDGIVSGIETGKKAEYDAFWDTWQQNGNRTSYIACFAGQAWTDELYNPKYPINATSHAGEMFKYSQITSTKVPIVTDMGYTTSVFQGCTKLKTIPSLKVTENNQTFSAWFNDCPKLEEINFTEDSVIAKSISFFQSPLLNTASVNGIIHALKDLTGAATQTLTFHADVKGKLTDAQKAAITAKNWQLG